ncbi:MAG: hypothetical protein KGN36_02765 [Acidobacteriota bacterium]|nr:hypothetical protein [Acidobacteriota bacterium]
MKLIDTYLLASAEDTTKTEGWKETHQAISNSIKAMVWPKGGKKFRIPRKFRYKTSRGGKVKWRRNGVNPVKAMFRALMKEQQCLAEHCLKLDKYFTQLRDAAQKSKRQILHYPGDKPVTEKLNESVGDFDFYYEHESGFKTVVEWESGNISSSHRSLNKMCMALWANLCDAAVLVLPSRGFYEHLTDRIGNVTELEPYFYFFQRVAGLNKKSVLAIYVVEHDELFGSQEWTDFIPTGGDGNSETDTKQPKKLIVLPPAKKRTPQST